MNIALAPGDVSGATNPLLDVWLWQLTTSTDGSSQTVTPLLTAPTSLTFQVSSRDSTGLSARVYPASGPAASVDLTLDHVVNPATGVTEPGHYAADWTVPDATPLGHYEIQWVAILQDGTTRRMVREFDVLHTAPPGGATGYCLVSDLREEGLRATRCSDQRALGLIRRASAYIDRVTGRFFEPRFSTLSISGVGGRALMLGDPIIAISRVTLGNPVVNDIGLESFRVFNRHLTQRLTNPDDRDNPKLEFIHYRDIFGRQRSASVDSPLFGVPFRDLFFPAGVSNVNVTGLWGFTDWDGSCQGATPDQIRHLCKLLVLRDSSPRAGCDGDDGEDARNRWRITGESTKDQSYSMQARTEGALTGDLELDDILLQYQRPIQLGAA